MPRKGKGSKKQKCVDPHCKSSNHHYDDADVADDEKSVAEKPAAPVTEVTQVKTVKTPLESPEEKSPSAWAKPKEKPAKPGAQPTSETKQASPEEAAPPASTSSEVEDKPSENDGAVSESLKAIESGAGQLETYKFWLMVSVAMHVIVLIVLLILSMGDNRQTSSPEPADEPAVEETETDSQDFGSWLKNRN